MELVVPAKPPREENKLAPAERAAILTAIASVSAVIITALRVFFY